MSNTNMLPKLHLQIYVENAELLMVYSGPRGLRNIHSWSNVADWRTRVMRAILTIINWQ